MKRSPSVAGMFYPDNPEELQNLVHQYIDEAKDFAIDNIKALITPHAGYVFSGSMAGVAYYQLKRLISKYKQDKPLNIFLIGPSHHAYIEVSVGNYESCETPLGSIKVNQELCEELQSKGLPFEDEAHRPEHCLEVQLPFIQTVAPEAQIIPILCGSISPDKLADILDPYFQRSDCFFIISSDLSHHLPYEQAVKIDRNSLDIIESCNLAESYQIDACGKISIEVLMRLADKNKCKIKVLDYCNSGDMISDRSAVVGYGAVIIYKK